MEVFMAKEKLQECLDQLVRAAVLAPSGDNLQPWQFEVDLTRRRIIVRVDETRDPSPMNAGQRMSRIAVGAAVENILHTVQQAQGICECHVEPDGSRVVLSLSNLREESIEIPRAVQVRVTNRRFYDEQPIPAEILNQLAHGEIPLSESDLVKTHWITERDKMEELARIVAQADEMLFSSALMRRAFLDNVRFDRPDREPVDWGLPLGALEVQGAERAAFRMLPRMPDWLVRLARVSRSIGQKSARLVLSASGTCLVTCRSFPTPQADLHIGRLMQRSWLALTRQGLAAQPLMSLMVLDNSRRTAGESAILPSRFAEVDCLIEQLQSLMDSDRVGYPAFLLRFGHAEPPSAKTGRLPSTDI